MSDSESASDEHDPLMYAITQAEAMVTECHRAVAMYPEGVHYARGMASIKRAFVELGEAHAAVRARAAPGPEAAACAETPAASPDTPETCGTKHIITARSVDFDDAERAYYTAEAAASVAASAAMSAKAAAFALMVTASKWPNDDRPWIYTLVVMGSADHTIPAVTHDVRATSEGRAWAEMARHSPRFAAMINGVRVDSMTTWDAVYERIELQYKGQCRVLEAREE